MKTSAAQVVVHIPHSSTNLPVEVIGQFVVDAAGLSREILAMTDWYTDELFNLEGAAALVYPYSRLACDPERFPDDADEPMAARGMGAIYTKTSQGAALRRPVTAVERTACIQNYYEPHHARLSALVDTALAAHGECLILDAHSFPSVPLPCDWSQAPNRPDICIGTDSFHTPLALTALAVQVFTSAGSKVNVDDPYAGALVPMSVYGRDRRVSALMIEINRSLYMNERTGDRLVGYGEFQKKFHACLARLCADTLDHCGPLLLRAGLSELTLVMGNAAPDFEATFDVEGVNNDQLDALDRAE